MTSKKIIAAAGFSLSLLVAAASPSVAQGFADPSPDAALGMTVSCPDLVPELDDETNAASTSGVFSSQFEAWRAFDGSNSSMWISEVFETPAWIGYDFGSTRFVTQYTLRNTNGSVLVSRAPKDFEFQGWDGAEWLTLDVRTGETGWVSNQPRTYGLANPGLYSAYRLYVTDDNDIRDGVVVISLGDLRFESCLLAVSRSSPAP